MVSKLGSITDVNLRFNDGELVFTNIVWSCFWYCLAIFRSSSEATAGLSPVVVGRFVRNSEAAHRGRDDTCRDKCEGQYHLTCLVISILA